MNALMKSPLKLLSFLFIAILFNACDHRSNDLDTPEQNDETASGLYFRESQQDIFEAKLAEQLPARLVGSWDGKCSKAFRLQDGIKPTSVKEIHEVYPNRDSKSLVVFYLGENCQKGKEVFLLSVDIEAQSYSTNIEDANITVTGNIENVYFEILNIPGNKIQKDLILQKINAQNLCGSGSWEVGKKKSIAGATCVGMEIPEKGRFYLNNYWIKKQNMKAMLSLNPIHRDEVKVIEDNQLFDQKPFTFKRKTKEIVPPKIIANKPSAPQKENISLEGLFKSSCVKDKSSFLYRDISLNRITEIDFSNRVRTDTFYLPTSKSNDETLKIENKATTCEEGSEFYQMRTGFEYSIKDSKVLFNYDLNSEMSRKMPLDRVLDYRVTLDEQNKIDIPAWSQADTQVYSCEQRVEWNQCTKPWLMSSNFCLKSCDYEPQSKEYKVYLPLSQILSDNPICKLSDWSQASNEVRLSACGNLSFENDNFSLISIEDGKYKISDSAADYSIITNAPTPTPEVPGNDENDDARFLQNWQTSEKKTANGISLKTTIDLNLKDNGKGFFSLLLFLGWHRLQTKSIFRRPK